jgi:uncharacterized protein (TIGR02145 family)
MGAASANAQVIIGSSTDNPHEGAILDLKSANQGLLLPRVDLVDFEILTVGGITEKGSDETAMGMTVYNTNAYALDGLGIYIWNGSRWNGINAAGKATLATCESDYYLPDASKTVDIPIPAGYNAANKLTFLAYNLGANPNIAGRNATAAQIAKAQMAYSPSDVDDPLTSHQDITVYGGFYQWGRKDKEHSLRCDATSHVGSFKSDGKYSDLAAATSDGRFVVGSGDWISSPTDDLWGNGKALADQSTLYTGTENAGNPCPSGFRVPTQYEWSILIGNVSTNAANSYSGDVFNFSISDVSYTNDRNPNIVWVRVKNGKTTKSWKTGTDEGGNNYAENSGFALYATTAWNNYTTDEDKDLTANNAPDPLMYLPAAGLRGASGGLIDTGAFGNYWCSVIDGSYGWHMYFDKGLVCVNVPYFTRIVGLSVRCLSE